jgi:hypothetical protein
MGIKGLGPELRDLNDRAANSNINELRRTRVLHKVLRTQEAAKRANQYLYGGHYIHSSYPREVKTPSYCTNA